MNFLGGRLGGVNRSGSKDSLGNKGALNKHEVRKSVGDVKTFMEDLGRRSDERRPKSPTSIRDLNIGEETGGRQSPKSVTEFYGKTKDTDSKYSNKPDSVQRKDEILTRNPLFSPKKDDSLDEQIQKYNKAHDSHLTMDSVETLTLDPKEFKKEDGTMDSKEYSKQLLSFLTENPVHFQAIDDEDVLVELLGDVSGKKWKGKAMVNGEMCVLKFADSKDVEKTKTVALAHLITDLNLEHLGTTVAFDEKGAVIGKESQKGVFVMGNLFKEFSKEMESLMKEFDFKMVVPQYDAAMYKEVMSKKKSMGSVLAMTAQTKLAEKYDGFICNMPGDKGASPFKVTDAMARLNKYVDRASDLAINEAGITDKESIKDLKKTIKNEVEVAFKEFQRLFEETECIPCGLSFLPTIKVSGNGAVEVKVLLLDAPYIMKKPEGEEKWIINPALKKDSDKAKETFCDKIKHEDKNYNTNKKSSNKMFDKLCGNFNPPTVEP